jgi:hypothetical protein
LILISSCHISSVNFLSCLLFPLRCVLVWELFIVVYYSGNFLCDVLPFLSSQFVVCYFHVFTQCSGKFGLGIDCSFIQVQINPSSSLNPNLNPNPSPNSIPNPNPNSNPNPYPNPNSYPNPYPNLNSNRSLTLTVLFFTLVVFYVGSLLLCTLVFTFVYCVTSPLSLYYAPFGSSPVIAFESEFEALPHTTHRHDRL